MGDAGTVRIGIGGWQYDAWRGTFYPAGLARKRELDYAAARLTSIEINGTFYGSQKAESFARWHDATPDGFVFALKAPRFAHPPQSPGRRRRDRRALPRLRRPRVLRTSST